MNNEQLTPRITPELITRYPDQLAHILNRFIEDFYDGNGGGGGGGEGNLEDIIQTTTSYDDGGINIITAYLSDHTERYFQIRNGKKGSQGNPGTPGADGQAATVSVGTTTTLPAGSSATVSNVGTSLDAVFNFGIPRGADGSPGQAATVTAGTTTTLPAGSSASVTNSGTSSAAVFDFSIPKGDTGASGQDGADGADGFSPIATVSKVGDTATITITDENGTTTATVTDGSDGAPGAAATITAGTTTTLSPGSSATVTNSGTSSAAVFDFGIPQGATGSPGADGADGADGFSPIATVTKSGDTATISITDANGTTTTTITDGADANVVDSYSTSTTDAYSANYVNDQQKYLSPLVPRDNLFTAINANEDLNNIKFRQPGVYVCRNNATAATIVNRPTNDAFLMEVKNLLSPVIDVEDVAWPCVLQEVHTFQGQIYLRPIYGTATPGSWTYGSWSRLAKESDLSAYLPTANISLTTTDPGKNSALAANHFVAVYEN